LEFTKNICFLEQLPGFAQVGLLPPALYTRPKPKLNTNPKNLKIINYGTLSLMSRSVDLSAIGPIIFNFYKHRKNRCCAPL
jgi:hypothetical protein